MGNLIKSAALLALLCSRVAITQTVGRSSAGPASPMVVLSLARETRLAGGAPIGHRQPHAADVPSENAAVDRKLNILSRLLS